MACWIDKIWERAEQASSRKELRELADEALGARRRGRKFAHEYPTLTSEQMRRRRSQELPLGETQVTCYPGHDGLHELAS